MSANVQAALAVGQAANESPAVNEALMARFASRQSNEIIIAFAGPIGCGINSVINGTKKCLSDLSYTHVEVVKLSKFLETVLAEGRVDPLERQAGDSDRYYRYRRLQQAGRDVRERSNNRHLLAEYAAGQIHVDRERRNRDAGIPADAGQGVAAPVPGRVAYLIDQVKRPEEVELLRALYRNIFYLVGVTKPFAQRCKFLEDEGVEANEVLGLIGVDRDEGGGGQQLDRTLHLSDFFVRNDLQMDQRDTISRFVRLIHGDKSLTPNRLERGMYAAYSAGLRSACLSRQVGAAIATSAGEILATGCNDVPAPGGGLYTVDSAHDDRCVHKPGVTCFNDSHKRKLQQNIGRVVKEVLKSNQFELPEPVLSQTLKAIYKDTRLGSLIEFSRSVHAEMDAIVSLARAGGSATSGTTLFSTTFPCHSCARHIVAAGIKEVYYIEPYEKSMAQTLHEDAIAFEAPAPPTLDAADLTPAAPKDKSIERVQFLHFEGVAPRLFATVFRAENRKDKTTGKFVPIQEANSKKVLPEYMDNYMDFEAAAVQHFLSDLDKLPPKKSLTE